MSEESGIKIQELRVDGGPTRNKYLMQFQSDIADVTVQVPQRKSFLESEPPMRQGLQQEFLTGKSILPDDPDKFSPEMEPEVRK